MHKALSQAVILGYIRFNPANNVTLPRIEKPEIKPLTDDDVTVFINAIRGSKYELLYLTDLFTVMRMGEILGLTWDCVDFVRGTIIINKRYFQDVTKRQV